MHFDSNNGFMGGERCTFQFRSNSHMYVLRDRNQWLQHSKSDQGSAHHPFSICWSIVWPFNYLHWYVDNWNTLRERDCTITSYHVSNCYLQTKWIIETIILRRIPLVNHVLLYMAIYSKGRAQIRQKKRWYRIKKGRSFCETSFHLPNLYAYKWVSKHEWHIKPHNRNAELLLDLYDIQRLIQ